MTDVSGTYFVHPFRFEPTRYGELQRQVDAATVAWRGEGVSVWEAAPLPEGDLLPRAAALLQNGGGRLWRLRGAAREPFGLSDDVQWALHLKGRRVPFRLGPDGPRSEGMHGGALLALFDSGVGFLTVSAAPRADDLGTWLDFLHYFRLQGPDARPVSARVGDADFCLPGAAPAEAWPFSEVAAALLRTAEAATWWTEAAGRLMPFSIVFLDGEPDDGQATALYQLRNCFHRNLGRQPSAADVAPNHPSLLPYARRQWFATGFESAAFVAFDAPDDAFYRKRLPAELSEIYFLTFLVALYQRCTLGALAQRLAAQGDDGTAFEALLAYTSRGHLAQVAHDAHPHMLYARLRAAFQVETLFDDLNAEVRARHDLASSRAQRRLEARADAQEAHRAAHVAQLEQQRADQQAQGERLSAQLEALAGATDARFEALRQQVEALAEAAKRQVAALEGQRADQQSHVDLVVGQVGQGLDRLAELVKQHVEQSAEHAKVHAEQVRLQAEQLAEHTRSSAEQSAEQARAHAEKVAQLVELHAEQAKQHAEQAKQHAELLTRLGEQHAEQMAKLVEQHAEQAKQHAEQVTRLGEQQMARLGEHHAERMSQGRSLDRKIGWLALLIGVPALVTSFLGINVNGWTTKTDGISLGEAVGYTLGGLVVGWVLLWWLGRDGEGKAPPK